MARSGPTPAAAEAASQPPAETIRFNPDTPPEFVACGRFVGDEGWSHLSRVIDNWELLLGLEGEVYLQEAGRRFVLGPGDVCILQPDRRHGGWQPSRAGTSFIWVHFRLPGSPALPGDSASPAGSTAVPPACIPVGGSAPVDLPCLAAGLDRKRLLVVLQQLLDISRGGYTIPRICDYLCGLALLEYAQGVQERANPRGSATRNRPAWFELLLEWIRLNLHQPLTVQAMARQCGKNPDYLNRVFRACLGTTALAHLHRLRMDRARELLMTTDLPVKQIAHRLGFRDLGQFLRLFRTSALMTPSAFRNEYTRTHLNRH